MFERFRRKRKTKPQAVSRSELEGQLDQAIQANRTALARLLVTRKAARGSVKKTRQWELSKTNSSLFRIESDQISVLIATAPFLMDPLAASLADAADNSGAEDPPGSRCERTPKERIQGLLFSSELNLNRALQSAHSLAEFLQWIDPPADANSLALFEQLGRSSKGPSNTRPLLPPLSGIRQWSGRDLDQMIAKNSINTLAHVLIHADSRSQLVLRDRFSRGLLRLMLEEQQSLSRSFALDWKNPHSRQRPLAEYEAALLEFRQRMQAWLQERDRSLARESRKALPQE
ncbi:MAG: hypothetical protein KDK39_10590 [Leptospiraceae bacterium]|nr:hypothetical protein [Leptospiraceae bacterium]